MSTEYSTTPVDELKKKRRDRGADDYRITVELWADHHDVFPLLTPFPHRNSDPIGLGLNIAERVSEIPETQMELTRDGMNVGGDYFDQLVMKLAKCHRVLRKRDGQDNLKFWNPEYKHYDVCFDPIEDRDNQIQFYETHASIGIVTPEWIAKHLGMSVEELQKFVEKNTDHSYPEEKLSKGRKTMARTAYTTLKWDDYTKSEIATGLGVRKNRLEKWIKNWVTQSTWKPPEKTSGKQWLKSNQNH